VVAASNPYEGGNSATWQFGDQEKPARPRSQSPNCQIA